VRFACCVCVILTFESVTDFHKIWHELYAVVGHSDALRNLIQSVVTSVVGYANFATFRATLMPRSVSLWSYIFV
jgi:hypothetical protein